MPHKAKRNLPSSTPSTLTANYRRTVAGHTYLALDHGLNDNHLSGAMHFLDLAGYGMTHARIEPHQIPLGPVHVAMLLLCSAHSLLSVGPTSISVITSHLVPFRWFVSSWFHSSRLVSFSHTQTLQAAGRREGKRVQGEEGASRNFKRLQAGWCIAVNTNRRNNTWLVQLNINLPHFTATARKHARRKKNAKKKL